MKKVNHLKTLGENLKHINQLLQEANIEDGQSQAEMLLSYTLGLKRSEIYLNRAILLKEKEQKEIDGAIKKMLQNIPLQYITRHQEFMGIDFLIDWGVLIPRPETEILVEESIKRLKLKKNTSPLKVLDLGTGSGVIAISLVKFISSIQIFAVDISSQSIHLASLNADRSKCKEKIIFLQGNWFDPLRGKVCPKSFDAIISNPPYVSQNDFTFLPTKIKNFEPLIALNGGDKGLESISKIISQAPYYLKSGGFLALEIGNKQALEVKKLILQKEEFRKEVEIIKDYSGQERIVIAYKK
ncbi:MAG: peptide chain release factor N(5)-glutamine methyltransferase [Candidatus Caldatribacteriota bacterium]